MATVFLILSLILAIAATVLAFIFIVPAKSACRRNKFGAFIHDLLTFKFLVLEKVLQALYIFATAYIIFQGFFMLFMVDSYGWGSYKYTYWYGGWGLLTMILGPIVIRLIYEGIMMAILLVKNVIEINKNVKKIGGIEDVSAAPSFNPTPMMHNPAPNPAMHNPAPQAAPSFCATCGTPKQDGQPCPRCGRI
ncbi:MAG: hypothetical protein IJY93_10145 [Clostridia bacterium]|nr:hypothetical protein [Clostridia bacterium]